MHRPTSLAVLGAVLGASLAVCAHAAEPARETVTGIGGFFFRADDPAGLARWYQQHLGISSVPTSYGDKPWRQEEGPTAFMPFPQASKYFDTRKGWMMNFRVKDLDRLAAQLRAEGIAVEVDPQTYPNGRFAHLHDPEGNPIELWQPMTPKASH
jgi:predicted enzyme related to lactoylglutathione lyase